jgi:hypothetical protein
VPRQTRETALPKPPAPPIDWEKIAQSGRVWEFIEGEDFTGKASSFRARAKTAARKSGVDFESAEVQRGDQTVLKVLASFMVADGRGDEPDAAPAGTGAADAAGAAAGMASAMASRTPGATE